MKNKKTCINSLASLFIIGLILNSCTQGTTDVANEIALANKGFMKAFNNGDAGALAANYTTNAKLFPSNSEVIVGQESIKGFWNAVINMGIKKALLETVTAESQGDVAVEEGTYKLFLEGDQIADKGKYIVIWKKENGQWKLQKDIWNTNNPAPQKRATENDTVWVIQNHVKADKVAQFEDFNFNYLEPATAEHYPAMRNTARILKPTKQNEDGTYTYFYLMDPAISPDRYNMMLPLTAKYGEEKAKEYYKMFKDCLKNGKQEWKVTRQTAW